MTTAYHDTQTPWCHAISAVMLSCTSVRKACLVCMHNWSSDRIRWKTDMLLRTMRGGKKNVSLWLCPNVKGNGLPLIVDALLWMSCFWLFPKWIHDDRKVKWEDLLIGLHIHKIWAFIWLGRVLTWLGHRGPCFYMVLNLNVFACHFSFCLCLLCISQL